MPTAHKRSAVCAGVRQGSASADWPAKSRRRTAPSPHASPPARRAEQPCSTGPAGHTAGPPAAKTARPSRARAGIPAAAGQTCVGSTRHRREHRFRRWQQLAMAYGLSWYVAKHAGTGARIATGQTVRSGGCGRGGQVVARGVTASGRCPVGFLMYGVDAVNRWIHAIEM